MTDCPSCAAKQPDNARFCFSCGAALGAAACEACGSSLVPGARFCSECGSVQSGSPGAVPQPVTARRVTSVLFGDLVGFTSLSEDRDQEDTRDLLSRYFDECRQVIGRYGGTVEKFIGDAVMAVWGVPTAHEDDAERSVRAGLELVNDVTALGEELGLPGLAMRVGIVTGEVAVTVGAQQQGMVAGDAVNTASRVQSVAAPGQVWVDETTRLLTSAAITYVDVGAHRLKGKLEPVPLWAVRAVVAARGGGQRADGLEAPLVGRDRELRLVKEVFHGAEESGLPSLLVVDGDAGVGKSRLAWEFEKYVDGLQTWTRWHSGRCVAYGEGVAYYALADAVRGRLGTALPEIDHEVEPDTDLLLDVGLEKYVPDLEERVWLRPRLSALLGTGAVGTFAREDLFSAWATFLERVGGGDQTVILVIDDAQHADDGLIQFIEHLLAVATFPCFVLMMTRPGLLEAHPTLATNRRATVVHLSTLPAAEVSALLEGLVAGLPDSVRDRLVERAEGVPLFAVETVRSLIDRDLVVPRGGQYVLADAATLDLDSVGAPASLQALISARLDAFSPEQRRLIDRASVLGGSFRRQEIAALCPEIEDLDRVLGELGRLQIFSRESSRLSAEFGHYHFVQSVVRQVAYATLSRRDRKSTHLEVVELFLREEGDNEEIAAILAQHYLDALEAVPGDPDIGDLQRLAIAQLERAAARSGGLGAHAEAAGHLQTALDHASEPADRARLESDLAWAQMHAGLYAEAAAHAAEATRTHDGLGDVVAAALAASRHARILGSGLGDNEQAMAIAEPRWERLQGHPDADEALLALADARVGSRLRLGLDIRDAVEARLLLAERMGSAEAIADSILALAVHYQNMDVPSLSRVLIQAGADMARAQHRPTVLARALTNLTVDAMSEDLPKAITYGREAVSVATATGSASWISFARVNLALALLEQGGWDELEAILRHHDAEPVNIPTFLAVEAWLRQARDEPWSLAWDPGERPQFDDVATVAWQLLCEAQAARVDGRLEDAVALGLEATETALTSMGRWDDFPHIWSVTGDLVLESGNETGYRKLTALAGEDAERSPLPLRAHRARIAALWASREDPVSEAVATGLRSAVDLYARWGSEVHRARTEAALAAVLTAQGRGDEATALVERARRTFSEVGATVWLDGLDRTLLGVG